MDQRRSNGIEEDEEEERRDSLATTPIKHARSSLSPGLANGTPSSVQAQAHMHQRSPSRAHLTPTTNGRETPDPDATFLSASAALEESLAHTQTFLTRLRTHSTVEVSPEGVVRGVSAETDVAFVDRQPMVEKLVYDTVRTLYDTSKEREGQIRELREAEREAGKQDKSWQDVLGGLEELPKFEWEKEDFLAAVEPLEDEEIDGDVEGLGDHDDEGRRTPIHANGTKRSRSSSESSYGEVIPPTSPLSIQNANGFPLPSLSAPQTVSPILSLRSITSGLISQLSRINESNQVFAAQTSDAGRKLKHLRGVLATWKEELRSVERSKEAIEEWEKEELKVKGGGWGKQAKYEMEMARLALEKAGESEQYRALVRDKEKEETASTQTPS
ncbi:hypothetical protein BT69DRAFT_1277855 [Atractiella rhizophila]|nr:hypothetical protein BT69DRAFT_1277855 [Atractiella rhizophila]